MKERQKLTLFLTATALALTNAACRVDSTPARGEEAPPIQETTPQELIDLEIRLNEESPDSNFEVSQNNDGELALYSEFGNNRWEYGELKENKEGEWVINAYVDKGAVEVKVNRLSVSEKKDGLLKVEEVKPGDKGAQLIPYLTIPLP